MRRASIIALVVASVYQLTACGGTADSGTTTQPPVPKVDLTKPTAIALASGDGQTARIKSPLLAPASFRVTNAAGSPLPSVAVSFAVTAGGGTLLSNSALTDANGSVTLPAWTLGPSAGTNTVSATVSGLSPVTLSATGRLPYWTVMVYMAADNTLAPFGALNLAQMSSAGVNPEVQVVVEAEFSPTYFAQYGLSPAMFGRANYNTFQYVMDGSVKSPSNLLIGPTTDIGNVNMTDPAQLRAFVQWAKLTVPSQHTVLVLWNHGGDAQGLIKDETSAPNNIMSLSQLTGALTGVGAFDVIDFEMCLMAGYEPLSAVKGLTQAVVASEEEEVVNGWDFGRFLQAIYADPTAGATATATKLANAFDAAYLGTNFPETISAFDMGGFVTVDAAVSKLAAALTSATATAAANISAAAVAGQHYVGDPTLVDISDFTDSLRAHVSDANVASAALSLKQAVTSSTFLLATHFRNATGYNSHNLSRSRGLQIVMPAGSASLASAGQGSLGAYTQQFPTAAWTAFLQQWVPHVQAARPFMDVGANTTTLWTVWDSAFVRRGFVTTLLLEPDGTLSGPAFGTLSPSGQFSADAISTNAYYEGWASNEFVEVGTFNFLAWLISDATNYQPLLNVGYQIGRGTVQYLYGAGKYPRLSFQRSFLNDPSESLPRILLNSYTDLQVVATWKTGGGSGSSTAERVPTPTSVLPGEASAQPSITPAQVVALRRAAAELRRIKRQSPGAPPEALREMLRNALVKVPRPD